METWTGRMTSGMSATFRLPRTVTGLAADVKRAADEGRVGLVHHAELRVGREQRQGRHREPAADAWATVPAVVAGHPGEEAPEGLGRRGPGDGSRVREGPRDGVARV